MDIDEIIARLAAEADGVLVEWPNEPALLALAQRLATAMTDSSSYPAQLAYYARAKALGLMSSTSADSLEGVLLEEAARSMPNFRDTRRGNNAAAAYARLVLGEQIAFMKAIPRIGFSDILSPEELADLQRIAAPGYNGVQGPIYAKVAERVGPTVVTEIMEELHAQAQRNIKLAQLEALLAQAQPPAVVEADNTKKRLAAIATRAQRHEHAMKTVLAASDAKAAAARKAREAADLLDTLTPDERHKLQQHKGKLDVMGGERTQASQELAQQLSR